MNRNSNPDIDSFSGRMVIGFVCFLLISLICFSI